MGQTTAEQTARTTTPELAGTLFSPRAGGHLASLDGLRGFSCLIVVFYHCWCLTGKETWFTLHPILAQGYSGVEMFFLLSGFCLAYPMMTKQTPPDWRRYAVNRARRILPPYWIAWILFTGIGFFVQRQGVEPFASKGFLSAEMSSRNLLYSFTLIGSSTVWSYWTLPLEWRWYFLLPLVYIAFRRFPRSLPLLMLLSLGITAASAVILPRNPKIGYYTTELPVVLPFFIAGMWAADITVRKAWGEAGENLHAGETFLLRYLWPLATLACVVCVLVRPVFEDKVRCVAGWLPLYFLILIGVVHSPRLKAFFSAAWLVRVGVFSYSLYLVHEPFVRAAGILAQEYRWSVWVEGIVFYIVTPLVCVAFAYLFYLVAERPWLRAKPKSVPIVAPA